MIGRALEAEHLKKVFRELDGPSLTKIRNRALIMLAYTTGARVGEIVALDLEQVLEYPRTKAIRIREVSSIRRDQIKGKKDAGIMILPEKTRLALRRWIRNAVKARLLKLPAKQGAPLFTVIQSSKAKNAKPGDRLSRRRAQAIFSQAQRNAGIYPPYRFHDLRHTYMSLLAEADVNPFTAAAAARLRSIETQIHYVHTRTQEIKRAVNSVKW